LTKIQLKTYSSFLIERVKMKNLVVMQFGSQVYGTSLPTSDVDLKAVHLPSAKQILLQSVENSIVRNTKKNSHEKNTEKDEDYESFSLQKYLNLILEGQTVAVDMLFVPEKFYVGETNLLWKSIIFRRQQLLSRKIKGFLGYCRTQANKYGIKGSRVSAVRKLVDLLSGLHGHSKIEEHLELILRTMGTDEHFAFLREEKDELIECCNRKCPTRASVSSALGIYKKVLTQYGHRALMAESNEGVDWKALMHAVRIAHQSVELLQTGHVTFPRPEAPLLLQIRKGEMPYKQVAEIIEQGLIGIEEAALKSNLPENPDSSLVEQIVLEAHEWEVRLNGFPVRV
jgi:predicted nucleotidyltransferase